MNKDIKITEDIIKEKINSADYSILEDVGYYYGEERFYKFLVFKNDVSFKVEVSLFKTNFDSLAYFSGEVSYDKRKVPLIIVQFDGQDVFDEEVKGDDILNLLKYKMSLRENYIKNKFLQI